MPKPAKKLSTGAKIGLGVAGAVLVVYVAGVAVFNNVFMPNSKLLDRNVSLRSVESVARGLDDRTGAYSLKVSGDGIEFAVPGKEVGVEFDAEAYAKNAIQDTDPWLWPVTVFQSHDIETARGATFDRAKLDALVSQAVEEFNKTATAPTDATIAYDEGAKAFKVVPESFGTQLDVAKVQQAVADAVSEFDTSLALGDAQRVQAKVTKDDAHLAEAADKANQYLKANFKLDLKGLDAGTIDASRIIQWVTLNDQLEATLDTEAIKDWGLKDLSKQLDTVGTERVYTRPDGKTITVSGGTYGWNINSSELADLIVEGVTSGRTEPLEVPAYQTAEKLPDSNGRDFGDTYIDVDIPEQHARMYKDGQLVWETDIVTGNSSQGHDTPHGVYFIDSFFNKSNPGSTLIGKTDPETKKPEYETPVKYWMPFIGNSIGFHDADWRSSFGGDIYSWNGSHGCVNLPPAKAAELCGMIEQGLVVVVHG